MPRSLPTKVMEVHQGRGSQESEKVEILVGAMGTPVRPVLSMAPLVDGSAPLVEEHRAHADLLQKRVRFDSLFPPKAGLMVAVESEASLGGVAQPGHPLNSVYFGNCGNHPWHSPAYPCHRAIPHVIPAIVFIRTLFS